MWAAPRRRFAPSIPALLSVSSISRFSPVCHNTRVPWVNSVWKHVILRNVAHEAQSEWYRGPKGERLLIKNDMSYIKFNFKVIHYLKRMTASVIEHLKTFTCRNVYCSLFDSNQVHVHTNLRYKCSTAFTQQLVPNSVSNIYSVAKRRVKWYYSSVIIIKYNSRTLTVLHWVLITGYFIMWYR